MTSTMSDLLDAAIKELEQEEEAVEIVTDEARELVFYLLADCHGEPLDSACVALTVTLAEILDRMEPSISMAMKLAIINTLTKGPSA